MITKEINETFRPLKYEDLTLDNHLNFPPYSAFKYRDYHRFRSYDIYDNYHECDLDDDFIEKNIRNSIRQGVSILVDRENILLNKNCSSIFRSVDKLRLLDKSFDDIFMVTNLKADNIIKFTYYGRNNETYSYYEAGCTFFCSNLNLCSTRIKNKVINNFRNLFGEEISFYFLWLHELIIYILFPSFLGIISFCLILFSPRIVTETVIFNFFQINIKLYDILKLSLCLIIPLWCKYFMNHWNSTEKLFSYLWGCEKADVVEPYQESFIPDNKKGEIFIFKWKIFKQNQFFYKLRLFLSNCLSIILALVVVGIYLLIVEVKKIKIKQDEYSYFWRYFPVALNAVLIKIVSTFYRLVANCLSQWENHEKISTRQNQLAVKVFIFEFVNNFFTYFYIGLFKSIRRECLDDDCVTEIEIQVYLSLFIMISFNFIEIGLPFFSYLFKARRIRLYSKSDKVDNDNIQIEMNILDPLYEDYIEILISLGYVLLLTSVAPLTPILIFITLISEKCVDSVKIYYFLRVENLNFYDGTTVYNQMIKMLFYIGALFNVALYIFTTNNGPNMLTPFQLLAKLLMLLIMENLIFFLAGIIQFHDYPTCNIFFNKFIF